MKPPAIEAEALRDAATDLVGALPDEETFTSLTVRGVAVWLRTRADVIERQS